VENSRTPTKKQGHIWYIMFKYEEKSQICLYFVTTKIVEFWLYFDTEGVYARWKSCKNIFEL
jgi:hypothetical protein